METLVLASSSPRRKEVLRDLSIPFLSIHPDIDESVCDHLEPSHRVVALAEKKALAGETLLRLKPSGEGHPRLLLAADTLVAFHLPKSWKTVGKPSDRDEARAMLSYLSGKSHTVFTGLCLLDIVAGKRVTSLTTTTVRFGRMTEAEIEAYLDTGEWRGAAGAYRVQGRGSCFIEGIKGSWSCVVGLPIRELYGMLTQAGYEFGDPGRA